MNTNNKHKKEEINEFIHYPLNMKKCLTRDRIREAAKMYDLYVSFSGGKDSEVAVDFTAKTLKELGYSKMHVLYIHTGLEYLSVTRFVKPFCELVSRKYNIEVILNIEYPEMSFPEVLATYGYPVISKEVAQTINEARKGLKNNDGTYQYRLDKLNGTHKNKDGTLSQYNIPQYKFLLDAPFRISDECCPQTKEMAAIKYENDTHRIGIIATSVLESRLRMQKWLRFGCNAFEMKRPQSYPFSFWTKNDFLTYIHEERLPIAEAYGEIVPVNKTGIDGQYNLQDMINDYRECEFCTTGCDRTGCIFCLFGITQDLYRIQHLQEIEEEKKRIDFVLRGGQFDDEGMWVPTKDGLGYWFVLDWLSKHGIEVPYVNKEKYRRKP